MAEPRTDMLPDKSQTEPVVSEDAKTSPSAERVKEIEPIPPTAPKEVKTPEKELLAALKEERLKRKEAEHKIRELESISSSSDDGEVVEGGSLKKEVAALKEELYSFKVEREKEVTHNEFPQLTDKLEEFDLFREDYPGVAYNKAARLFLNERGLLDNRPERKGLERPTAGAKLPTASGVSVDDVKRLRETQPRVYLRMLQEGKLKPETIK